MCGEIEGREDGTEPGMVAWSWGRARQAVFKSQLYRLLCGHVGAAKPL